MATQVRETSAGKSVSAFIVMNKKGEHVATVNAHFANSGRVTVDVWNTGAGTVERCLEAALKAGYVTLVQIENRKAALLAKNDWMKADTVGGYVAQNMFGLQQGGAGGGGYDKFAAALSGLWIDGQQIANHCGTVANAEKAKAALFAQYCKFHDYSGEVVRAKENGWDRKHWDKRAEKIGARFANYSTDTPRAPRYASLHFAAGLERLEMLGYRVIQAL